MRAVKDIWAEMVDRRLWPIAVVLVAALVAVPLLMAKSPPADVGEEATPVAAAAAAAADLRASGEPVVSVAGTVVEAPLRGRAKNPFIQQHVRAVIVETDVDVAPPTTNPGDGDTSGGGGGGTGDGDAQPAPQTYTYASVDVRFGRAGSPLREIRDVPRLAPLPSAAMPIVIFLGTRADHETAVFMVSTDVHAQGDGRCVPSQEVCEAIELREDQVAFLDFTAEDGSVTQYELDLVDLELHETTSESKARAAYARASEAGRALVHRRAGASAVTSALRYSERTGVLDALPGTWLERDDDAAAGDAETPQAAAGAHRTPTLTAAP